MCVHACLYLLTFSLTLSQTTNSKSAKLKEFADDKLKFDDNG